MRFALLENAKKKAAAILGSDKDIPDEKADLGKLADMITDAYADMDGAAQDVRDKLDKLLAVLDKWTDALKQTDAIYQKNDFGLDKKSDTQKIARIRKCFEVISVDVTVYSNDLIEIKKAQTQYRAAMKRWVR